MISCIYNLWKSKIGRKMRTTVILIFICISQTFAAATYSQNTRLSLNMSNVPIREVLKAIEDQTEFYFMFEAHKVDVDKKVSINIRNSLITDILNDLFNETGIIYKINNRQIALTSNALVINETGQQKSITGKVTDKNGQPLSGVTVVIKGTSNGTVTNMDGTFSFSDIPANATLAFSFVGMKSQELEVAGKSRIDVKMMEEAIGIDEVVAIGYGTMKKSDLTGSVIRVDMGRKEMAANIELTQALQGYLPGINAGASGNAGKAGALSIRGQTSLSASDEPLIVVDGIIFNGTLADVNVNDIESVDILKDASAAAVYGSRSANGVIIITTKRGTSEKPLFNFNMYYGFQDISNTKRTHVMNADEYAVRMVDYYYQQELYVWYATNPANASDRPVRPDVTNKDLVTLRLRSTEEQENYAAGNEVDWIDKVQQNAPIQNYDLNVSGKTGRTNYFLSSSYTNQKGVLLNDQFKRETIRANFENTINDYLTLGLNTSYSHLDYSGLEARMDYALVASPLANIYDESGVYPTTLTNEYYQRHPLGLTEADNKDITDNIFYVLTGKLNVPQVKGLTYEINYSQNLNFKKVNTFYPASIFEGAESNGLAEKNHTEERGWLLNSILSYSNTFGGKHKISSTFLFSRENRTGDISSLTASNFENATLGYNAMELGKLQSVESGAWEENSLSYMARVNYVYDNRYMLTTTFRKDGYSGFGADHKFANFPSVSVGWVVNEESFLNQAKWLDFLKLRLSYGLNGNQGIGRYASLATMAGTSYVYNGTTAIGIYPNSLGNSDLGWESTASFNLGLDYTILDQRITGQIDVYDSKTSDVLVERSVPPATGYSSVWSNIGEIKNKGIEIGLTTRNIKNPLFSWETRFIFSLNRNKISKLYEGVTEDLGNEWFVGKSIGAHYDYTVEGVWQEEDFFSGKINEGYYPGQYKLKSLNGDKIIDPDNDRSIIGYSTPNYRFGINNSFSLKNITFSFFLNSIQGGNGYYTDNNYEAVVAGGDDEAYRKNRTAIRPYWRPDRPVNNAPGMFYSPPVIHGVYESRSFVRLQDVSLSYDFKKALLEKWGFDNLQVYLSGKNLYTWTDWSGWDPEIYNDANTPMMRSVIAGIKVSF